MSDVAGFTPQERKLFRQRKVLPTFLAGVALVGAALSAAGFGSAGMTGLVVFLLVIFGFGTFATEHATRLERFDTLLGDERMARIATLRFTRRVLRGLVYAAVLALAWLPSLRGDLPLIAAVFLAGVGCGLYAQVVFYKEVALIQPVVDLTT